MLAPPAAAIDDDGDDADDDVDVVAMQQWSVDDFDAQAFFLC